MSEMAAVEPPPIFVRPPKKSSAVRIVNPETLSIAVSTQNQLQPRAQAADFFTSINGPSTIENEPSSSSKNAPKITSKKSTNSLPSVKNGLSITGQKGIKPVRSNTRILTGEDTRSGFDIYAKPFIPESFSILNTLPGLVIDTAEVKEVDFEAYVGRYIGWNFLPPIPPPSENLLPIVDEFQLEDHGYNTHYESYFRYHLDEEIRSHRLENETFALYGHAVTQLMQTDTGCTCSFLVPGLGENSPYVEEDDIVQLRQLIYAPDGTLFEMRHWLDPSGSLLWKSSGFSVSGGHLRGEPAPGWTGIIYNARVLAVIRRESRLVVAVNGLTADNFAPMFSSKESVKFNIQFQVSKNRYLPMHHVLPIVQTRLGHHLSAYTDQLHPKFESQIPEYTSWIESMLFPTVADSSIQATLNTGIFKIQFFDKQLNWEQKKAVESVCKQDYGTLPFLISGPPGTGKTKTLIEIALQLVKNVDGVEHVLFCAPSDPAADMIVQRISRFFKAGEMLRLNRASRAFAEVPGGVMPFCCISQSNFDMPTFQQLMSTRLVVTTTRDASLFLHTRVTNNDLVSAEWGLRGTINPYTVHTSPMALHWTALLIDEAAQAMEPEALIPLSVLMPPINSPELSFKPLVVMAGDEHQLGPRTSLPSSKLKLSLFARLFSRPVYADHPLARGKTGAPPQILKQNMLPIARPAFTNLIRNYRSHPAILAVPSALFYADTLEPEATDTDRLAPWPHWRGKRWPVLFHNNESEDELEVNAQGWFNAGEARIACKYVAELIKPVQPGQSGLVAQNEVCIMSPFKGQVAHLRKMIRKSQYGSLWEVDVGPTEAFQGLERGVVILCTTRSKSRFVESDMAANWGLIGMPNKMNVALTRAKYGLIVIGNREVLKHDPNWKSFLEFCDRNGLVTGEQDKNQVPLRDGGEASALTRLEKVLLAQEQRADREERTMKVVNQEDEMWTAGMRAALDDEFGGWSS